MPAATNFIVFKAAAAAGIWLSRRNEKFAAEVPWFKYVSTISRPWEDLQWGGQTGRVDDLVRQYATEWDLKPAETTGYLCGHPNMVENAAAFSSAPAGKREVCSRKSTSSLPKKTNCSAGTLACALTTSIPS